MTIGYGQDTWCFDAYHAGRIATGRHVLAAACYRRLTTPRGTLRGPGDDASAYGFDLIGFVGSTPTDAAVALAPGLIVAELRKDDRIAAVSVAVNRRNVAGMAELEFVVSVEAVPDFESFTLTVTPAGDILQVRGLAA